MSGVPYVRRNILLIFSIITTTTSNWVSFIVQVPLLYNSNYVMVPLLRIFFYALVYTQIFIVASLFIKYAISFSGFVFPFSASSADILWRKSCLVTFSWGFRRLESFTHHSYPVSASSNETYGSWSIPFFDASVWIGVGLIQCLLSLHQIRSHVWLFPAINLKWGINLFCPRYMIPT